MSKSNSEFSRYEGQQSVREPFTAKRCSETSFEQKTVVNWWTDRYSLILLVALYTAQGLPIGLVFGSVPFLLKERGSSYADLAKFSFASLPYSLKLLIAPFVDSFYSPTFGRRKSWIVPVQFAIGCVSLLLASKVQHWVNAGDVNRLMPTFMFFMALAATQDIAVDGWSVTILKKENVSFASTCQSLGLSVGYFATFTIYLAFSNAEFCNHYVRPFLFSSVQSGALVDLSSALRLMSFYFLTLTTYVAFGKRESVDDGFLKKADGVADDDETLVERAAGADNEPDIENLARTNEKRSLYDNIKSTYSDMFVAVRLSAVKSLVFCLLIAKVGMSAYENVSSLKLLEFGFSKEKLASTAVLQTPFILLGSVLAGRWVAKTSTIHVYKVGWILRFVTSLAGPMCVAFLKQQGGVVHPWLYTLVLTVGVMYSIASECLMFVGMGAFFLTLTASSIHVAGSYLTLLNTASNMGGTWHKPLVLWLVDSLTVRESCSLSPEDIAKGLKCAITLDGYYVISILLIPISIVCGVHIFRTLPLLHTLPDSAWRAGR